VPLSSGNSILDQLIPETQARRKKRGCVTGGAEPVTLPCRPPSQPCGSTAARTLYASNPRPTTGARHPPGCADPNPVPSARCHRLRHGARGRASHVSKVAVLSSAAPGDAGYAIEGRRWPAARPFQEATVVGGRLTMSHLHKGDADMHYSDSSHRWIAPPDVEQTVWEAGLRAHLALHRVTLGGPATVEQPEPRPVRIPRPRTPLPAERIPAPASNRTMAPNRTIQQLRRAG
jgi:hypothetical protein